ncbi:MAG: hypothetical protein D6768_06775 [Chloroflexi bacterium]|nr:MAG: hypothetical protein D6768_06775 [Chloroflexota bacterium]
MAQTVPLTANQLGLHRATYRPKALPGRILLGASCISLLVSLLMLWSAASNYLSHNTVLSDSFRRDRVIIGLTVGLFALLAAAVLGALFYYHISRKVELFTNGFVYADWRSKLVFRWDAITEVYVTPRYYKNQSRIINWMITVRRNDGQQAEIGGLEYVSRLGQLIQTEVAKHLLPQTLKAYQSGQKVQFGPQLSLSLEGVHSDKKTLPWPQVADIKLDGRNNVIILQKDKQMPWDQIRSDRVGNPLILKAILNKPN